MFQNLHFKAVKYLKMCYYRFVFVIQIIAAVGALLI